MNYFNKGLTNIAGAILVIGLVWASAYVSIASSFKHGAGWGFLAVIAFFFYGWQTKGDKD